MSSIRSRVLASAALLMALALPASAQQPLRLSIQDGRVTLHAQNVTVRAILAEWTRIGGTTVVNAERITGGPVTLQLNGVSEREAIDVLLRGVAGYVLGARLSAAGGASSFDRILILPTSVAPRTAAAPAFAAPGRIVPPQIEDADDDSPAEPPQVPQLGQQGRSLRALPMRPEGMAPQQFGSPVSQPEPDEPEPEPEVLTVTPGNPFGVPVGSSSAPGVVTPVPDPRPPQPRQSRD